MSSINIKVITRLDDKFKSTWQNAWEKSKHSHFFNSAQWFVLCLNTFDIKEYFIFVCYQGKEVKAIWPLVKLRKYGVKFLSSPGKKYLDKSSLLLFDNSQIVIKDILEKILIYGNLYLAEVSEDIKEIILKLQIAKLVEQASVNPYISLESDPLRFLNNKHKNEIKNKIKRYNDNFSFKLYNSNLDKYLKLIFTIEDRSFKKKKGRHIFYKKEARRLFENIIKNSNNNVVISLLYFNREPIAHMVGVLHNKTFLAYHMAYLANYRRLIPGKILLYFLLLKLRENNFDLFDFSRGDSILKRQFTTNKKIQYNIFVFRRKSVNFYITIILYVRHVWLYAKKFFRQEKII